MSYFICESSSVKIPPEETFELGRVWCPQEHKFRNTALSPLLSSHISPQEVQSVWLITNEMNKQHFVAASWHSLKVEFGV